MASLAATSEESTVADRFWKNRLTRYYQKFNPSKIDGLDAVLQKYKGKEHLLFIAIQKKYGPEPSVLEEIGGEAAAPSDEGEVEVENESNSDGDDNGDDKVSAVNVGNLCLDESAWPVNVTMCPIDGLPVEYCEFGKKFKTALPWLLENCPELYLQTFEKTVAEHCGETGSSVDLRNEGGDPVAKTGTSEKPVDLSDPRAAKKAAKKIAKAEATARKEAQAKSHQVGPRVLITMKRRNKRKFTVNIGGLELFGVKLKEAAKNFSKKFACSSTVTKNDTGEKEVVMQGDFSQDLGKVISEMFPSVPFDSIYFTDKKSGTIAASKIQVGQKLA
jgi:density-regulated protein